ncbi:MAG: hypothetical protein HY921_05785 [Elusimicrobia bacterium]|nr:hypothetical protein [Elusimicrobiota bacterium]
MPPLEEEEKYWLVATLLALPAFIVPAYNPDIFWHFSAARWMLEHRAWPARDFLSFTAGQASWADFEWLSQILFFFCRSCGGMWGLWLAKAGILLGAWFFFHKTLKAYGISYQGRAAALVLWSAALLPASDIRPELFSILLFSWLLWELESHFPQAQRRNTHPWFWFFPAFALWSNLHGGFALGLVLILLYAVAEVFQRRWDSLRELGFFFLAALAGSFFNPYGWGPHLVILRHWRERAFLSQHIKEWHPTTFENPLHWPFWVLLAAAAGLVLHAVSQTERRRRLPWGPALAALYLGLGALAHARLAAFSGIASTFLIVKFGDGMLHSKKWRLKILPQIFLAYAAFLVWTLTHFSWSEPFFSHRHVPVEAARFLAREKPVIERLRLYNPWEWGGYLGWELGPWYRVFSDGRYIFHPQLLEQARAISNSHTWQEYLKKQGLTGVLTYNLDLRFPTERAYPGGGRKSFPRPWYLFYMPRERWALVYWDWRALLFVDREFVPAEWLKAHEYRYWLPKDDAARNEALRLGEIPLPLLEAEKRRQQTFAAPRPGL